MEQYTGFAGVYDEFMDNVPYDEWVDYLYGLLVRVGVSGGILCELGCGTGKITRRLKGKGYDMIGIDCSAEMLQVARGREKPGDESILYLQQDMREFELYGTVAGIVSICDSMNYILTKQDMLKVFKLVNNYLDINGVFIFDLNTVHYYKDVLSDNVICDNREDASLIWENSYDQRSRKNRYDLTLYTKEPSGMFQRCEETHFQRAYALEDVKGMLDKAGLEPLMCLRAFTDRNASEKDERVYFVAKTRKTLADVITG
ncbi:MAG: class I SAM-dependent methyltransferase [Lachnospiraceae bacterium]|nr:class I SAM-dependent methyltransferase [Lachnospiraceae bacterium]